MRNSSSLIENRIWLTTAESASYLGLSPNAFRIMLSREKISLNSYSIGFSKTRRFKREDLDYLMKLSNSKEKS